MTDRFTRVSQKTFSKRQPLALHRDKPGLQPEPEQPYLRQTRLHLRLQTHQVTVAMNLLISSKPQPKQDDRVEEDGQLDSQPLLFQVWKGRRPLEVEEQLLGPVAPLHRAVLTFSEVTLSSSSFARLCKLNRGCSNLFFNKSALETRN